MFLSTAFGAHPAVGAHPEFSIYASLGNTADVLGDAFYDVALDSFALSASEHKCNDKDMQAAAHLKEDMKKCMGGGNITGLSECLEKDGFSKPCVGCITDLTGCVMKNCIEECSADSESEACQKCSMTHCMKPFSQCSGFPTIDPNGKCGNAKDLKFLGDMKKQMLKCAWTLVVKGSTTLEQCLHQHGCSEPCSGCVGTLVKCAMGNCGGKCKNQKDPACKTCMTKFCMKDFGTCSGIKMPDMSMSFIQAVLTA